MRSYAALAGLTLVAVLSSSAAFAQYEGWTIPASAKTEKSPFAGSADAVKKGKAVFSSRCQRCHGPQGKGNGPEADPKVPPANLTQIKADENPEGVLFYKVWNGHSPRAGSKGSMPAFKVQLVREEVWRVVEYVRTLRAPNG
jgi:mono/diheme cytochrome c family protein